MSFSAEKTLKDPFFWAIFALACISCFLPFRQGEFQIAYFADDFYYYVRIAQNLAATGLSTYDGSTLTNGYHPLWLIILTLIWKITGGHRPFFVAVNLIIVAGTAATYLLSSSILSFLVDHKSFRRLCSLWLAGFYLYIGRMGMEVVLTVPLALLLLRFWLDKDFHFTKRTSALGGLLASFVVLSRLDSSLIIALIGVLYMCFGQDILRKKTEHLIWMCVGLLPVLFYVISNKIFFGTFGTVSALAKHLKVGYVPNAAVIESIVSPFGPGVLIFVVSSLMLIAIGCVLLVRLERDRLSTNQTMVAFSLLIFPILYFLLLAMTSEWRIFSWYDYPLIFSSLICFLLVELYFQDYAWWKARFAVTLFSALAILFTVALFIGLQRPSQMRSVYLAAVEIRGFASSHPARYAMGDRAGIPGYLLPDPLIQVEGLVMDKKFLENIREQKDLVDVLRAYNVRYYVSTDNVVKQDDCYLATEPILAGTSSPKMRGKFCAGPVASFLRGQNLTLIFDVSHERQ